MSIQLSCLTVAGQDAATFLQGQITADVHHLTSLYPEKKNQGLAAICNRQGRVMVLFWMVKVADETFHLLLPRDLAETIEKHLKIFIFRSKVTLQLEEPTAEELAQLPEGLSIPWITAENSEAYVPQMLSLDLLGAISFKKGCYTGQEIVARMQYLGKHKRRLALITAEEEGDLSCNATITNQSGKEAGTVVYHQGHQAFAVVRLEEIEDAPLKINATITIDKIWHDEEEADQ